MPDGERLKVYYDGRCPLCQWSKHHVERRDRGRAVEFFDIQGHAGETPFRFDQLSNRMHVRIGPERWASGFAGWAAILRRLPGWRWLGRLMGIWPISRLGESFYNIIATRRYRLGTLLLRWFGAPPPCDESCTLP